MKKDQRPLEEAYNKTQLTEHTRKELLNTIRNFSEALGKESKGNIARMEGLVIGSLSSIAHFLANKDPWLAQHVKNILEDEIRYLK